MHKELIVLGILEGGAMHGHELHRIVQAHGELYADLKKANLYHLVARLAEQGYLKTRTEPGTRGRRGERVVYAITPKGRRRLASLLRDVVCSYETLHSGIEVAVVLLADLPIAESLALLRERRTVVQARKKLLVEEFSGVHARGVFAQVSADHVIAMVDAELAWIDRALKRLSNDAP